MNKLVTISIPKQEATSNVETSTNHILVIDCSGSMCYDLPKIRHQLKNKLPVMVKEQDTVSLVWFSGKGEFGFLVDSVKVKDLNDLNRLNVAIDRWLKPMGCTGFVEPLRSVEEFIGSVNVNSGAYSMMFLTDGCDNQWSKNEILDASKSLAPLLSGAVFVEYGWYCNHAMLEEMASEIGGSVVFAEDFDSYDPIFDGVISKRYKSSKKVEITVDNPLFGLVYSISENGAVTYKVEDNKVYVPEDVTEVFYFTEENAGTPIAKSNLEAVYQGLAVLTLRRKGKFIREALAEIGDVRIFNKFANCFGKQNLFDFQKLLLDASKEEDVRFAEGKSDSLKVNPNAFTLFGLLSLLQKNRCFISLKEMKYNRIGRMTESDSDTITASEKQELLTALEEVKNSEDLAALLEKSKAIIASKQKLKFIPTSEKQRIIDITWNETRPNVSMLFKIEGHINLPDGAPENLPKKFSTSIYRNYTIIRDGLLNIDVLPVVLNKGAYDVLHAEGIINEPFVEGETYLLNLRNIPMLNENDVTEVSAENYFRSVYSLYVRKAANKVYEAFLKEIPGAVDAVVTYKELFGEEAANYLSNIGVTDSGFSPKVILAPSRDYYIGTELKCSLKGLSSIPSFNAFIKKLNEGKKLNTADELLLPAYKECVEKKEAFSEQGAFSEWLLQNIETTKAEIRELARTLAKVRFSIIVGQTWFKEFETIEDNSMTLEINDREIDCKVELKDIEVQI